MRVRVILIAALFPFLHNTTYKATFVSCQPNEIIIQSEQEKIQVSLFNIHMKQEEEGWIQACSLLEKAEKITFEIDPSSRVEEPIPVWLFVDDILIQEELVKQGQAFPMIRNPEYTYEKRLEEAYDVTQTMASVPEETAARKRPVQGPLFLGVLLAIWGGLIMWVMKQRKIKQKHS